MSVCNTPPPPNCKACGDKSRISASVGSACGTTSTAPPASPMMPPVLRQWPCTLRWRAPPARCVSGRWSIASATATPPCWRKPSPLSTNSAEAAPTWALAPAGRKWNTTHTAFHSPRPRLASTSWRKVSNACVDCCTTTSPPSKGSISTSPRPVTNLARYKPSCPSGLEAAVRNER